MSGKLLRKLTLKRTNIVFFKVMASSRVHSPCEIPGEEQKVETLDR